MKKILIGTLITFAASVGYSQEIPDYPTGINPAPKTMINLEKMNSDFLIFGILGRINSVYGSIDGLYEFMSENNLDTYRDVFRVEGALIYDHEIAGKLNPQNNVGRNAGLQVLPFEVSMNAGEGFRVKVAAVSFKNMNAANYDAPDLDSFEKNDEFKVINNVNILNFVWDRENNDFQAEEYRVGEIDLRLGLFASGNNWLALSLGATLGGHSTRLHNDLASNVRTSHISGVLVEARSGLETNFEIFKKMRLNLASKLTMGARVNNKTSNDESILYLNLQNSINISKGFKVNGQPARIGLLYRNNAINNYIFKNVGSNGQDVDISSGIYAPKHEVGIRLNF